MTTLTHPLPKKSQLRLVKFPFMNFLIAAKDRVCDWFGIRPKGGIYEAIADMKYGRYKEFDSVEEWFEEVDEIVAEVKAEQKNEA